MHVSTFAFDVKANGCGKPLAGDSGSEGILQQAKPLLELVAAPKKEKRARITSTRATLPTVLTRLNWTGVASKLVGRFIGGLVQEHGHNSTAGRRGW